MNFIPNLTWIDAKVLSFFGGKITHCDLSTWDMCQIAAYDLITEEKNIYKTIGKWMYLYSGFSAQLAKL